MKISRIKLSQYFPKPFKNVAGNINDKLDLSNCTTKTDLKNITHIDTLSFALKTLSLARLKTEIDKLDIDKLVLVLVDLSNLSDVVKNHIVKKAVYEKLAAKVNNIDTSAFVLKTKYEREKAELEKKIPDVTDFAKETKLTELENKTPDISSLAAKTVLTAVKNKIPDVSSLVKKKILTQKSVSLKRNLLIITMTNILLFQGLIL